MRRRDRKFARRVQLYLRGGSHAPSPSIEQGAERLRSKLAVILRVLEITDAERAVTIERLLGDSVGDVANKRRSTDGTVKSHSRRVHAAVGVRSHASLAGLVLLLVSEFERWFGELRELD